MAQQLIAHPAPQAYAGVLRYARAHTGEASAAAYMALGQAYMDEGKFLDAAKSFEHAKRTGQALDDYADYLGAKADLAAHDYVSAQKLLQGFADRHSDSILSDHAALLLAQATLSQGDPQSALQELAKLDRTTLAGSSAYLFTLAHAHELAGNRGEAQRLYTRLYVDYPTSSEAGQATDQLHKMGIASPFTVAERVRQADGLYLAGHYAAAAAGYKMLASDPAVVGTAQQNDMLARQAVANYKQMHHVDPSLLAQLSDTNNNAGATRLYLMVEAARDAKDTAQVQALIGQLEQRFPNDRWTREALFSAGNMALLANDLPSAIRYYGDLAQRFPNSSLAPVCHWHAAWLTYRLGNKQLAAQRFDQQIALYPTEAHVSAALYWRGMIYQDENNPAAAAAYFRKLADDFRHYYYAGLARQRLAALGSVTPSPQPQLARIVAPAVPDLTAQVPDDEIHVERARLLANAGLNQYIVPEISASDDSGRWGAYAEAELYSSYGENWRSLEILKRKVHSYFAVPIDSIPQSYWNLLFPQPYWPVLARASRQQGLDPYLVASLIRQESEFNPNVISYANAWGLMQVLPSEGRVLARKEHVHPFRADFLLNPDINLKLGTAYLRELMDEFQDHPEYVLAAYNAGDYRVKAWLANGPYASLPEFVESIPFTQTREYVEAILRNREIYQQLYGTSRPDEPGHQLPNPLKEDPGRVASVR